MTLSCTASEILSVIFTELKRSLDREHIPFGDNVSRLRQYTKYSSLSTCTPNLQCHRFTRFKDMTKPQNVTSGQSNLTKKPPHRRTWTVQWYLPGGDGVHLIYARDHPNPQPKRHLDRFSQLILHCSPQSVVGYAIARACASDKNCAFARGDLEPHLIGYMVPWAHPNPQSKRHFNRLSRFCRTYCFVRQTDRPRYWD